MEAVTVEKGRKTLLDRVSISLKYGSFTALLGPNGAGKTTLIRTLLGFNRPSAGRVEVLGLDVAASAGLIRKQAGYVPQSLSVDRFFPVLAGDVIRMAAGEEQAKRTSAELRIENLLSRPYGLLSGGEKQKILLAMALAREPKLLLLDEPNLNLDMAAYRDFLSLVDRVHVKHKLTVIFITHLITQIPASCKNVIVMKDGAVAFETGAKRLLKCKKAPELIYG